jgi:hypothetical protein
MASVPGPFTQFKSHTKMLINDFNPFQSASDTMRQ